MFKDANLMKFNDYQMKKPQHLSKLFPLLINPLLKGKDCFKYFLLSFVFHESTFLIAWIKRTILEQQ